MNTHSYSEPMFFIQRWADRNPGPRYFFLGACMFLCLALSGAEI